MSYLRNLIISLSTMVLKTLILFFDEINIRELECCMDGLDVIFKLATSPILVLLLFPCSFIQLRTLVIGLDEIDVILKVATLDEVSNLNHFIWNWLIPQGFLVFVILDVGPVNLFWFSSTFSPVCFLPMLSWMWD